MNWKARRGNNYSLRKIHENILGFIDECIDFLPVIIETSSFLVNK